MKGLPWVVHPFLIAPLPILRLYARNQDSLPIEQVLWPSALALAGAVAVSGASRLARLDGPNAGLVASAALLLCFGFGHGVESLGQLGLGVDLATREWTTLAIEAGLIAGVVAAVRARPGAARALNGAANAASAALVVFGLIGLAVQAGGDSGTRPPAVAEPVAPPTSPPPGRKPDIYFLVLDAYGRSDVLKDVIHFDNSAFLDRLERKGFFVARRSTSNYCQTALSLAATLNLRYLDDLAGSRSTSRLPLRRLIAENAAMKAFRREGYRVVAFATGYPVTELPGADDYREPAGNLGPFAALVAGRTPLWLLMGRRASHEPHRLHRDRILHSLRELPEVASAGDPPTFVFAHILAPHPPFDFGPEGEDTSALEGTFSLNDSEGWCRMAGHGGPDDYATRYRDQAAYVTARVEEAVDRILARSGPSRRPIIVIQGDHGPGSHFDSGSDRPNDLRERWGILNAIYLPDGGRERLDEAITPVNTFRVILDHYLGSRLGRIADRNYHSPYGHPYRFTEVTSEVAGGTTGSGVND